MTGQNRQKEYAAGLSDGRAGVDPKRAISSGIADPYGRGYRKGQREREQGGRERGEGQA